MDILNLIIANLAVDPLTLIGTGVGGAAGAGIGVLAAGRWIGRIETKIDELAKDVAELKGSIHDKGN